MTRKTPDISDLLASQDDTASMAERHLWLIRLVGWLRGDLENIPAVLHRLTLLLDIIENNADHQKRWQRWWLVFLENVDMTALFADHGFAPRTSFFSEFWRRIERKFFPQTPDTADMSELFAFLFSSDFDIACLRAMDEALLERATRLLFRHRTLENSEVSANTGDIRPQTTDDAPVPAFSVGERLLMDALTYSISQVSATGFASEIRYRMSDVAQSRRTFHDLPLHFERFRVWVEGAGPRSEAALQSADVLKEQLDACRLAATSVYAHLEENGVSVGIVFRLRQLRERILRIRILLDCLQGERPQQEMVRLLTQLIYVTQKGRSVRDLISNSTQLIASKVAERSAQTGEHYIARNLQEYRQLLRQSAGGGVIVALTTWAKFALVGLGLSGFWGGFAASVNYSVSFLIIMLLHLTLATKQPAVTASAMAAKLKDWEAGNVVEGFVEEATLLLRSQCAAIIGNIGLVVPVVLLLSWLLHVLGADMMDKDYALHTLHDIVLPGYTVLYAAFTGVLLFASSIIAGWVENWFVLQRIDSALRYNPRVTGFLGIRRAKRLSKWLRHHISGLAGNVSLGFLLGLTPAFLAFFGIGLEVRHVTLATGQVAAAAFTLGREILGEPDFWWAMAGLAVIGPVNLGVSFYLAFRVALKANNINAANQRLIHKALLRAWLTTPLRFILPSYRSLRKHG